MPWLVAAALVHSAIVTERRGSLASWTILLAILGFGLALLGTFLVRSGVLTSVHAFAVDPQRGIAVLVLLGVALGAGFGLYAWRAPKLAQPSGFAAVSRESMLVWNNFGLAVAAGVVLIGTLYPLHRRSRGRRTDLRRPALLQRHRRAVAGGAVPAAAARPDADMAHRRLRAAR